MTEGSNQAIQAELKPATIWSYVTGFGLSIILTLMAYLAVQQGWAKGEVLVFGIVGLALVQMVIQFYFFLHLGQEAKPRWNLQFLFITAGIIAMVVLGSLWIMYHLNYLMMPSEMNNYLMKEENIFR